MLAHEISHVTQHHIARSVSKQKDALFAQLAAMAAAVLASRSKADNSGQMTQAAIVGAQGLALQMEINFTRQTEEEADRMAFSASMPPASTSTPWGPSWSACSGPRALSKATRLHTCAITPVTYERIAEAQARAQGKPFRQVKDSPDFNMVRALLKSYLGTPRDAVVFFEDAIAEKKYNDPVAVRYGLVASLLRAENYKRALAELAILDKTAPPHPMIEAMAGQVLMQAGQLRRRLRATRALSRAIRRKCSWCTTIPRRCSRTTRRTRQLDSRPSSCSTIPTMARCIWWRRAPTASSARRCWSISTRRSTTPGKAIFRRRLCSSSWPWKSHDGDFYQASVAERQAQGDSRGVERSEEARESGARLIANGLQIRGSLPRNAAPPSRGPPAASGGLRRLCSSQEAPPARTPRATTAARSAFTPCQSWE